MKKPDPQLDHAIRLHQVHVRLLVRIHAVHGDLLSHNALLRQFDAGGDWEIGGRLLDQGNGRGIQPQGQAGFEGQLLPHRHDRVFLSFFNGTTRTVRLTYVIKGGAPRSACRTRVMRAYASFCATPSGFDGGSVAVPVLQAGFDFATAGGSMSSKVTGNTRIYKSGKVADTSSFFVCFYGANAGGYKTETITADGGQDVALVKSWPEDPAWANAVPSDVQTASPNLPR